MKFTIGLLIGLATSLLVTTPAHAAKMSCNKTLEAVGIDPTHVVEDPPPPEVTRGNTKRGLLPAAIGEELGSAEELKQRKQKINASMWAMLTEQAGDPRLPEISWDQVRYFNPKSEMKTVRGTAYVESEFFIPSPIEGMTITGRILIPSKNNGPGKNPAVIYNHFHGGMQGMGSREVHDAFAFDEGPFGDMLIDEGYIVIATDTHGFGRRRNTVGRSGQPRSPDDVENGSDVDDEFTDTWSLGARGKSRTGIRTYDDIITYRLIAQHPLVDPERIGAMGMSMGCTRSFTEAAFLQGKLKAVVALGTLPLWRDVVQKTDKIRAHRNTQLFIDQLTRWRLDFDSFLLSASDSNLMLIMGDQDPSSPGWQNLFDFGRSVYNTLGRSKNYKTITMTNVGHEWTWNSVYETLRWFNTHLKGNPTTRFDNSTGYRDITDFVRRNPMPDMNKDPEGWRNWADALQKVSEAKK